MKFIFSLVFLISIIGNKTIQSQILFDDYEKSIEFYNEALDDIEEGNYQSATEKLKMSLKLDSLNKKTYINLNYAYSQLGEYTSLLPYLKKSLDIYTDDDELYYYTANAYRQINDTLNAIAHYDSAIYYSKINGEEYPLVYAYYLNRGICFMQQGNFEEAVRDFTFGIKLDDKRSSLYLNRGVSNFKLGKINEACSDWNISKSLGLTSAQIYLDKYCTINTE